jgi:hypothetical protein
MYSKIWRANHRGRQFAPSAAARLIGRPGAFLAERRKPPVDRAVDRAVDATFA